MSNLGQVRASLRKVHAYILAGGSSRRYGMDKALLTYQGQRFIDRMIATCAGLFGAVYVVGRRYRHPLIDGSMADLIAGIGPMGGVFTALSHAGSDTAFLVAVDYPLADTRVMLHLARSFFEEPGVYQALVPVMPDGNHPLFALYRRTCAEAARACIIEGRYEVVCIAGRVPVHFLDMTGSGIELSVLRACFLNVNRPSDYEKLPGAPG